MSHIGPRKNEVASVIRWSSLRSDACVERMGCWCHRRSNPCISTKYARSSGQSEFSLSELSFECIFTPVSITRNHVLKLTNKPFFRDNRCFYRMNFQLHSSEKIFYDRKIEFTVNTCMKKHIRQLKMSNFQNNSATMWSSIKNFSS